VTTALSRTNVGIGEPSSDVTDDVLVQGQVKVKFTLEQVTKAKKGSRGIALLFPQPRR